MDNTEKIRLFEKELNYIINPKIREFSEKVILSLPDYFFVIPASTTGKHHPAYSLGDGGLVRHTRAAIRIAIELARMDWWHFEGDELDLCLATLFGHDGYKTGVVEERYTRADHPNIAAIQFSKNPELNSILPTEQFGAIIGMTGTHMGQWNTDFKTGAEILEKPKTKLEKFVHLCDYLASRKCLEMKFDIEVIREN